LYRSGWVARLAGDTDKAFGERVAQLRALDVPTVLDEPPHVFVGPFEAKAQAQNVLRYLKSDQGLDGLVTWRSVTR
jgi:cell division septation protein DedD